MMKKFLTLLCVFAALSVSATTFTSQGSFYAKDFSIAKGQTKLITVYFDNHEANISGGQFQLNTTGPIEIVDEWVDYGWDDIEGRIPHGRKDGLSWTCDINQNTGNIEVIWYTSRKPLEGTSGALYYFEVTTTEDFDTSTEPMTIQFSDIKFSDINADKFLVPNYTVKVSRAITLADALTKADNEEVAIGDALKIMGVSPLGDCAFATDGNDNWIKIAGETDIIAELTDGACVEGVAGVLSDMNTNPTITITDVPEEAGSPIEVSVKTYDMAQHFAPKANEVIAVTGYYFEEEGTPNLRAYSGEGGKRGQSLTINTSWVDGVTMENGTPYTIEKGAIQLKEAWTTPENAPQRVAQSDDLAFQNYVIYPMAAPSVATGIEDLNNKVGNVTVANGTISVAGAANVAIYGVDGKLISNNANTNVPAGVYVVIADGQTSKVIVK